VSGNRDRDAEARQELAAALEDAIGPHVSGGLRIEEITDAVWPVVERIRERAWAEALEAAADSMDYVEVALGGASYVATELRTRAAIALRADVASEDAG
jgi:hypothetical protein